MKKNLIDVFLLCISVCAGGAQEAKQIGISEHEYKVCRAIMLEDGLKAFLAASSLKCKSGVNDPDSDRSLTFDDPVSAYQGKMIKLTNNASCRLMLIETIKGKSNKKIALSNPRAKLMNEYKKMFKGACINYTSTVSCTFFNDSKINFYTVYTPTEVQELFKRLINKPEIRTLRPDSLISRGLNPLNVNVLQRFIGGKKRS